MSAYYNEFDPYAAQWLRNLIKEGHIADGIVDERSIVEVEADDLREFTQCHFFAGLGGWSRALRLAGWADDRPVWTGSPPCQPFSTAGKQLGVKDERHLAPVWLDLVKQCHPPSLFGEQVAAAVTKDNWLDDLQDGLEAEGYATGAVIVPACGLGAAHIRQRLWLIGQRLADTVSVGQQRERGCSATQNKRASELYEVSRLADTKHDGPHGAAERGSSEETSQWCEERSQPTRESAGDSPLSLHRDLHGREEGGSNSATGQVDEFWRDADWLYCRDGKWRPIESGTFPLANGVSNRVGRLRAYGNAIVPQVAAEVIKVLV